MRNDYFRAGFINSCACKWEETGASGEEQVSKTKYHGLHEQARAEDSGRGLRSNVYPAIQRH